MDPAYQYCATVIRVVDGDTVDLRVDCGFRLFIEDRFRLYGINAPEVVGETKELGLEAKAYLASLLPVDTKIVVETFKPKDKYGRWLGILHLGNVVINDLMVSSGHAKVYFP